jgi:hypothetical protein
MTENKKRIQALKNLEKARAKKSEMIKKAKEMEQLEKKKAIVEEMSQTAQGIESNDNDDNDSNDSSSGSEEIIVTKKRPQRKGDSSEAKLIRELKLEIEQLKKSKAETKSDSRRSKELEDHLKSMMIKF